MTREWLCVDCSLSGVKKSIKMLNITDFNALKKLSSVLRLVSPPRISFDTMVSKKTVGRIFRKRYPFLTLNTTPTRTSDGRW